MRSLFIKKETPTQVVSCEFSEIFKNIFLVYVVRTPPEAAPNFCTVSD